MKLVNNILICLSIFIGLGCSAADSAKEAPRAKMSDEVKEIIAKSKKAMNFDKMADIKTMEQDANIALMGMNIKGTINIKLADKSLLITSKIANIVEKQGYNGKDAWSENIATGLRILKGAEKLNLISETLQYSFHPEKFYDEIKLVGKEDFNGKECFKLELIRDGMDNSFEYINTKTYLIDGLQETLITPQGKMKATTKVLGYKDHEKGFKYATKFTQSMGPMSISINMDKIKINPKFDNAVFNPPAQ